MMKTSMSIGSEQAMKTQRALRAGTLSLLRVCAYNLAPSGASVENVDAVKSRSLKPAAVGTIQSSKPGKRRHHLPCSRARLGGQGLPGSGPGFGPAVQKLVGEVVPHPKFRLIAN